MQVKSRTFLIINTAKKGLSRIKYNHEQLLYIFFDRIIF